MDLVLYIHGMGGSAGESRRFGPLFPGESVVVTVPESPMFNAPAAAEVTAPRLELVREAGRQYAEKGSVDAELLKTITSPMIPEEVYAAIVNSNV